MSAASAWQPGLAALVWGTGAFACAVVAAWLASRRECYGKLCPCLILALVATGGWALAGSLAGPTSLAEARDAAERLVQQAVAEHAGEERERAADEDEIERELIHGMAP